MNGKKMFLHSTWFTIWLVTFIIAGTTVFQLLPWFKFINPMPVEKVEYSPGESVYTTISYSALVGFSAHVTRELVLMEGNKEIEVAKMHYYTDISSGHHCPDVNYQLPENGRLYRSGTYKWRGSTSFRPFGLLEQRFKWETESFKIRVEEHGG